MISVLQQGEEPWKAEKESHGDSSLGEWVGLRYPRISTKPEQKVTSVTGDCPRAAGSLVTGLLRGRTKDEKIKKIGKLGQECLCKQVC